MITNIKDPIVLITGSTRGLGKGLAQGLAEKGARIILNYRDNLTKAQETADLITHCGHSPLLVKADVRDWQQADMLVRKGIERYGRIDVLINNVGDFVQKSLEQTTPAEWENMVKSNLNSMFFCCKSILPFMKKHKYGRIINIGVANADKIQSYRLTTAYAVAKTGVLILTKSLAKQVAPFNITVNSISPGLMDNGTLKSNERETAMAEIPAKRLGTAGDILETVLFLINDRANYITGNNIILSGGWGL